MAAAQMLQTCSVCGKGPGAEGPAGAEGAWAPDPGNANPKLPSP